MASEMAKRRAKRVEGQVQRELATLLQLEIKDPRIGFINITRVKLTDDLRFARVYWSLLGDNSEDARSQTNKGLRAAKGFLRGKLKVLRLRYLPELTFHYDTSGEDAERIGQILDSINAKTTDNPEPAQDPEGAMDVEL